MMQETIALEKGRGNSKATNVEKMTVPRHIGSDSSKQPNQGPFLPSFGASTEAVGASAAVESPAPPMAGFAFKLVKRGAKGRLESAAISVPTDSKIAKSIVREQEEKQQEIQLLKQRLAEFESRESSSFPSTTGDLDEYNTSRPRRAGNPSGGRGSSARGRGRGRGRGLSQSAYEKAFGS